MSDGMGSLLDQRGPLLLTRVRKHHRRWLLVGVSEPRRRLSCAIQPSQSKVSLSAPTASQKDDTSIVRQMVVT